MVYHRNLYKAAELFLPLLSLIYLVRVIRKRGRVRLFLIVKAQDLINLNKFWNPAKELMIVIPFQISSKNIFKLVLKI